MLLTHRYLIAILVFLLHATTFLTTISLSKTFAAEPILTSPAKLKSISEWPHYGGNHGGQRHSSLDQINASNIASLKEVWRYRTGDLNAENLAAHNLPAFEATPIQVNQRLYFCSPRGRVIALDP